MPTIQSYIMDDRECDECGYNLKGLPEGAKCPECGTPTRKRTTRSSGTMSSEAPTRFVRKLRSGFRLGSLGIIVAVLLSGAGLIFFGALAWVGGIFLITSKRPNRDQIVHDSILDDDRIRKMIRGASIAWPIYSLLIFALMQLHTTAAPPKLLTIPLTALMLLSGAIAWIGLIPTCIYLAELGYWASHDHLAQRLRSSAWTMAVFGVISVVLSGIGVMHIAPSSAAIFVRGFTLFIVTIAVIVFFFTVLQLSSVMTWVIRHQRLAAGSAQRVRERIERDLRSPSTVTTGLFCESCGYDLDGLPIGGRCPECGESFAARTPMPILDPATMHLDRDESEIEILDGENKGIYFNEELDADGKPKPGGTPYTPSTTDIPDEGDIPLSGDDPEDANPPSLA